MSESLEVRVLAAKRKRADLGKKSEAEVKKALDVLAGRLGHTFQPKRVIDARAARSKNFSGPGTVGDYEIFYQGKVTYIEVKETEKDYLPAKNFKRNQIARCQLRSLAGCPVRVIVHHTTMKRWRVLPIQKFFDEVKSQWDTSDGESFYTAQEAVDYVIKTCFNTP